VLFLCTGNSARSQMAEGLLRHLSGGRIEAHSAGTDPKGLNPYAVQAMAERGIDISDHVSKGIEPMLGQSFDRVITVCDRARQSCPAFAGAAEQIHWSIPDPAEADGSDDEVLSAFRTARDDLEARIRAFLSEPARAGLPSP
jgi:arsenate reductase